MDIKKIKIDFENPAVLSLVLSIVLFIVIMGLYYYLIYSGLAVKLSQKKIMLEDIKVKYNSYLTIAGSYPVLAKQQKTLDGEFADLIPELPPKKDIPGLLMKISNYEKLLGLNLKMFKPGKARAGGFYETIPFSMSISGHFRNVYQFFYKLASMKRIMDVHDVSVISRGSKGRRVSVNFKGTTFSFAALPPKKTAKKAGGAVKK